MSNLFSQRRIAASILNCGYHRVYIEDRPEVLREVGQALTREDITKLIKAGKIKKRKIQGTSRRVARERRLKYKRGQRRGPGSRSGRKGARTDPKTQWINKIRAQRKYLRELRDEGYLTPGTYRVLYRQAKGNLFRSVRYLNNYIAEKGLAEKKLPPLRR